MSKEIQFLLYSLPDEEGKVQVVIKDETLWCTQKAMAQLFGVGVPAISKHLGHIFEEGELDRTTTVSKMEIVVNRGFRGSVNEEVEFYSLDAIIAVGYRVSSLKATRFRQWATKILHEYIKKGFLLMALCSMCLSASAYVTAVIDGICCDLVPRAGFCNRI